jgi:TetR/AcrR family transcriptional repressor of nem operon
MARPREFDVDDVLDRALEVFWAKGFEATSLTDLLEAMELSKSSFYQTFESKADLYRRCLDRYRHRVADQMMEQLERSASGRAFIDEVFRRLARNLEGPAGRRACFVMNDAGEVGQRDEAVARRVRLGAAQFERVFRAAVERAQQEGGLPPEKDAQALARYLVSSRSGLLAMRKAGAPKHELDDVIDVTLAALDA